MEEILRRALDKVDEGHFATVGRGEAVDAARILVGLFEMLGLPELDDIGIQDPCPHSSCTCGAREPRLSFGNYRVETVKELNARLAWILERLPANVRK